MKVSPDKCHVMTRLATAHILNTLYTFGGQTFKYVDTHGCSGINLSNTHDLTTLTKKAQQTLGVIRRNLNKCPTHINAVAYNDIVSPSNIRICIGSMGPAQSEE